MNFRIFRISIKEFIGEKNIEYITYWFVYETCRVFTFKNEWYITWILAMLGTDHSYYWAHRMMHEVNIIWASHQDWIYYMVHITCEMVHIIWSYHMVHIIWSTSYGKYNYIM